MPGSLPVLVLLTCLISWSSVQASPVGQVTGLQSMAWLQQQNGKSELGPGSNLNTGDQISTDASGRVEMLLGSYAGLRLYPGSEIRFESNTESEPGPRGRASVIDVYRGRLCLEFGPPPVESGIRFELHIGNTVVASKYLHADICVLREAEWTSIELHRGSIQITHTIDPNMVILSEPGTVFRIDNAGSFELLKAKTEDAFTSQIETAFIAPADLQTEIPGKLPTEFVAQDPVDDEPAVNEAAQPESENSQDDPAMEIRVVESMPASITDSRRYIYTVYLFSTRSEDAAREANEKFLKAGYKSEIITRTTDYSTRYRVAVSGFKSQQAAETYSTSIIGKLGVTGTWIGREIQDDQ